MTTQEAIEVLEKHLSSLILYGGGGMPRLIAAVTEALETLRDKVEREDPKPLTIEELRQMHGQPVWLVDAKRWGIIDIEEHGQWEGVPFVCFFDRGIYHAWHIEKRSVRCLRHKPKEVDE